MMLTKSQKASAPASANATLFKYSKEQWREIKAEIQPIWNNALSLKEAREKLQHAARGYRAELLRTKARQEQQKWEKFADRAETLLQDILAVRDEHLQYLKNVGAPKEDRLNTCDDFARDFGDPLRAVIDSAQVYADTCKRDPPYTKPKLTYEFEVLSIWTRLGGKLRFSRNPKTRKIQGPLARFFRAVTTPVMGDSAPSLETLPDIVGRQRELIGKLR